MAPTLLGKRPSRPDRLGHTGQALTPAARPVSVRARTIWSWWFAAACSHV